MSKRKKSPGRNQMKRRIAPGIWEDADGDIHWSIPELLAMVELPETPENIERVKAMLEEMLKKKAPDSTVIFREKPD